MQNYLQNRKKVTILAIKEASFLKATRHTHNMCAHAVIDTTVDTHLNQMCQRNAYAHTHTVKCYVALHPVPEARKVGAPSISKYFGPSRLLDDRSYVKKIRKTRNQSVSPYLVT